MNCPRCGARLAADHSRDRWCSPCLRGNRDYDPRADARFPARLLALFVAAGIRRVEPLHELGIHPRFRSSVKDAVRHLRARGYSIEAQPRRAGYVYRGWAAPDLHPQSKTMRPPA